MWLAVGALVILAPIHTQGASTSFRPVNARTGHSDSQAHSTGSSAHWNPKANPYPPARRDLKAFDNFQSKVNGTVKVPNPYIWLQQAPENSTEVQKFISNQQNFTEAYLSTYPHREEIRTALTKDWNHATFGTPTVTRDGFYYFTFNSGLLPQDIWYRVKKGEVEEAIKKAGPKQPGGQLFLDPNIFSSDGTASLNFVEFSYTGKYVAYGISLDGSDAYTIHVRRTDSPHLKTAQDGAKRGEDPGRLPDEIERVKFSGVSWVKDDSGFFYSKYPHESTDANNMLYFHNLGSPTSNDVVIMKDPNHPTYIWHHQVSQDGKYLVVQVTQGTQTSNQIWFADLTTQPVSGNMKWEKVVQDFNSQWLYFSNNGTLLYLLSSMNAPNRKIVTYDISKPGQGFQDLVPEDPDAVLGWFWPVNGNSAVLRYSKVAKDELYIYSLASGTRIKRVGEGMISAVTELVGTPGDIEFFYQVKSFVSPGTIYWYRFDRQAGQELSIFRSDQVDGFDPDRFVTKQVFYSSKDGTRVPMFIVHSKTFNQNGSAPGLQYGYGGFGISVHPFFSLSNLMFVARFGGVLAVANIRGGDEFGEKWHLAGSLEKKQNVFDDFQYATKYLVANRYVAPDKVTILGGSNGGLLVAACANQAPELFGAVISEVGVLDMLRFPRFTIGAAWIPEYGDPNKPEPFDYISRYAPLQNINSGANYPALMLETSDHDDRVVPLHSFKYAAAIQYAIPNNPQPLLLRVTKDAGHRGGNTKQTIGKQVDELTFMALSLGLVWN